MKKLLGILAILLLVIGGCSQNESEVNDYDYEKVEEDNKIYEKKVKEFAKGIVDIADEHDKYMDNDETTDKETSKFLKKLENKLEKNRESFTKDTEKLMADGSLLGDYLVNISGMYETFYNETSRLYKLNDDKEEYIPPMAFALYTLGNNFDLALYETQYDYDDIGKEERDNLLGEKLSNDLDETLVVTEKELEDSYTDFAELTKYNDKITIPEEEYKNFDTDDASWKIFKLSGIQDEEKDVTKTEYNEDVQSYNERVHPIMQTHEIDEPTTMTISNHLITKMNAIVDIEYEDEE
ncbi:hypothetical protein [Mammaliicoccus fleurettii]|uniref:hypothetical protein n=1 Tax=Mammaliicoccus fleurettii TaxID=150056 RepID=UPI002DB82CD7|nr:hypothetical protein [Mammaliicoccus fleurettii]MEB8067703.1 hypothetical protein [Mammaliicoccus fleurettii]